MKIEGKFSHNGIGGIKSQINKSLKKKLKMANFEKLIFFSEKLKNFIEYEFN